MLFFQLSDSDLIQELLNILCERKELKVSHLHVLAHSNIKHLDLSMCSSLISDQLITAVGYRCKVRKHGKSFVQNKTYNEKCNTEIIKFLSFFCDIK